MSNIVTFSPTAKEELIKGVNILADAVGITLGPKGRNVVIDVYGVPHVTKDGVTVAKVVKLEDPIQNLGAAIIKQAASKTAGAAGDGTTSATVLAQALINGGKELLDQGISPIEIKRKYEDLLLQTMELVLESSKPVTMDNIKQIATVSANNDPAIGNLIHEGFSFVGTNGMIAVEDSKTGKTYVNTISGTTINNGYASPYFVTDPQKMECVYEKPLFLITDKKIRTVNEIIPALEVAARRSKPLVIIADEIEAAAFNLLVVNRVKTGYPVVVVRAPGFGDRRAHILEDLAILTGSELITEDKGLRLEDVKESQFGTCEKIVVNGTDTLIMHPAGKQENIDTRIAEVQKSLSDPANISYVSEKLSERLANLTGKIAVLYAGAATETELKEKKDRIDDALRATKSAIALGYVEGGGRALLKASMDIWADEPITKTFAAALCAPHDKILTNANLPTGVYEFEGKGIRSVDTAEGTNSLTGKKENLIEAGIIDPTLVVTEAISNAVSAANMILLSEVTIHDLAPKYDPRAGTEIGY